MHLTLQMKMLEKVPGKADFKEKLIMMRKNFWNPLTMRHLESSYYENGYYEGRGEHLHWMSKNFFFFALKPTPFNQVTLANFSDVSLARQYTAAKSMKSCTAHWTYTPHLASLSGVASQGSGASIHPHDHKKQHFSQHIQWTQNGISQLVSAEHFST